MVVFVLFDLRGSNRDECLIGSVSCSGNYYNMVLIIVFNNKLGKERKY